MKQISDFIQDFRLDARGADITQISDTDCLLYLNRARRDIINFIINEIDEDYYYEEWTVNYKTITGQREYTLPKRIDGSNRKKGCQKVKRIEVKFNEDGDYIEMLPKTIASINYTRKSTNFYENKTSPRNGFYMIKDNSVFFYPVAKEDVVYGFIIYGISDLPNLELDSQQIEVKIPLEIEEKVTIGMLYHYYRARGEINLKNDAKIEWENELQKLKKILTDRIISPLESELPINYRLR